MSVGGMNIEGYRAYSRILAPYACFPERSRGRQVAEVERNNGSCFQRDRDRIIHSKAFRRMLKTQVFVWSYVGDHYRNRLTHSIEVGQLARGVSRSLGLNEDLAETVALAHDLGHTPFGHAGEEALSAMLKEYGGFDHNAQSIRILTRLEQAYGDFDGLNLTWESLEGIAKHNGPVAHPARALREFNAQYDLELHTHASGEAQVAALCDDIAYANHDLMDGLRAGLFSMEDLAPLPYVGEQFAAMRSHYPDKSEAIIANEAVRRVINRMVSDLGATTSARLEESGVGSVEDIRGLSAPVAGFSEEAGEVIKSLKAFLSQHMYRHAQVSVMVERGKEVVRGLFTHYLEHPEALPSYWKREADAGRQAISVADYIAGMTDRFALEEYERLKEKKPEHESVC